MGFGRTQADAKRTIEYVCALDTAIKKATEPDLSALLAEYASAEPLEANRALIDAVCKRFSAVIGPEVAEQWRALAKPSEAPSEVARVLAEGARMLAHREYRDSGEISLLGELESDAIFWQLRTLTEPQRVKVKGLLSSASAGESEYERTYAAFRYACAKTIVGAKGWQEYRNDKNGRITEDCLDLLAAEWIIDIGSFVVEWPTLKQAEKKA